mmetsp:Transcript_36973/g.96809  ORF Transcript_36973/g.96809 Transcript_36973/m.96809 type:complete len:203 (+) Transcript_36973:807-1415(+)
MASLDSRVSRTSRVPWWMILYCTGSMPRREMSFSSLSFGEARRRGALPSLGRVSERRPEVRNSRRISSAAGPKTDTAASAAIASSTHADNKCPRRNKGFHGSTTGCSTSARSRDAGWAQKYWSRGDWRATKMLVEARPLRPPRPACCHRLAMDPGNPTWMVTSRDPISTPSSRALVDTTPSRSPLKRLASISRRCWAEYPAR